MYLTEIKKGFLAENLTEEEEKILIDLCAGRLQTEGKILPRPVVRDGNGKLVKEEYDFRDWYLKLQEEFFEMAESSAFFQAGIEVQGLNQSYERLAEELADIITVCISYLEYLDYDEKARSELFAKVNEKNEKRGYFKESD